MEGIRIAHISDPHFRPGKDNAIWEQCRDFLNNTVKPHAVLITGDVTDRAKEAEFSYAAQCLGGLNVDTASGLRYLIIPGNHDRFFFYGNTARFLSKLPFCGSFLRDKSGRFSKTFEGAAHVTPDTPRDLVFSSSGIEWKIRVVGLDSCEDDQWFAQGAVRQSSISAACKAARGDPDCDLVVVMVHHHVLPIPQLERSSEDLWGLRGVANFTGLLNSGTLLSSLSHSQVNIVLHGHEHSRNSARFAACGTMASDVVVLAAGSCTGEVTTKGWRLESAQFNVLELMDDRSVWLREVVGSPTGFTFANDRTLLLSAQDIRRARFVRRYRKKNPLTQEQELGPPTSRLRTVYEFTPERDIHITQTRSNWLIPPTFKVTAGNELGRIGEALLQFEWARGTTEYMVSQFVKPDDGGQLLKLGMPLKQSFRKADRVTCSYVWRGGSVLTMQDLAELPPEAMTWPHNEGRECASTHTSSELEALSISLRLPERFAPAPSTVEVLAKREGAPGFTRHPELEKCLSFCGRARIELDIPYPLPKYVYAITWPLLNADCSNPEREKFYQLASQQGDKLLAATRGTLSELPSSRVLSVALYGRKTVGTQVLDKLADSNRNAPLKLLLNDPRALARMAWWGGVSVSERDGKPGGSEFEDGEALVAMVPVRDPLDVGQEAMGLLRIGVAATSQQGTAAAQLAWQQLLVKSFTSTSHSVLQLTRMNGEKGDS